MTKISNFKSFVRLSLSCAFAFCVSIISCHATDLVDPISGNIVGTYDSSKREVIINSELARFDDQGRLPTDTDFAIQRALHSYAPVNYSLDSFTATINQHPVVITSAMNGRESEYDYEDFYSAYAFTPKKITFGEVVYDFSYTMEFSPENQRAKFPTGTLTISTDSNNTQRIYTPIVIAFGSTGSEYVDQRKGTPSVINSINIIGNFEEIPRHCFKHMPFLESVDASGSQIKRVCPGAFGYNHNSLNINTVNLPECCDKNITSSGISGAPKTDDDSLGCCGIFKIGFELIGKGGCTLL